MKYIRELLKKVTEEQYTVLSTGDFSKTELSLIHYYRVDLKDESDDHISELLSIKSSTLKKLQSGLLSKAIDTLCSKDVFEQIPFLSKNNCHKILIHLGKKQITIFKKNNELEKLCKLYTTLTFNLLSSIVSDYDIKDLKRYKKDYFKIKPIASFESVKFEIILFLLEIMQISSLDKKQTKYFKTNIDKIDTLGNPELKFWKNKLEGDFFQHSDEEKYMKILKNNYDLVLSNNLNLNDRIIINTKLQYCFYLVFYNKFSEVYNYYKALQVEYPKDVGTPRGLRYLDLFSQVCISLGKYDEARKVILSAYPIEDEPGKFAQIYFGNTTILAMLDLLENDSERAYKKISAAKIGLKKNYFAFLDSLLRLVEQAYYFKIKDFDFADSLYKKNIKFYQYHNISGLEIMESAHKILNYYSKSILDKSSLSDKYKKYLAELKQGDFAFVGHFIEKLDPNSEK